MNIDKQILKMLNETYGDCPSDCKKCPKLISQIKQSILKAIMKRKPKRQGDWWGGMTLEQLKYYNQAIKEFESVIKEILK